MAFSEPKRKKSCWHEGGEGEEKVSLKTQAPQEAWVKISKGSNQNKSKF